MASKLSIASESVEDQSLNEISSHEQLMDEAVLLYSTVSQRKKFDEITTSDRDIYEFRQEELTTLIEAAIFDAKGIVHEGFVDEELSSANIQEENEPATINEISQALDDQILLGYEATFTEDELDKWVEGIENLQQKLQVRLASSQNDVSSEPPPTPLDRMHARLGTMQALIDPEGSSRLQLPMAHSVPVSKPSTVSTWVAKPVSSPPSIEQTSQVKATHEIDNSKSDNQSKDPAREIIEPSQNDIETLLFEAMNKATASKRAEAASTPEPPPSLEQTLSVKVTHENDNLESDIESEDSSREVIEPSRNEIETLLIEAMNKAAKSKPVKKAPIPAPITPPVQTMNPVIKMEQRPKPVIQLEQKPAPTVQLEEESSETNSSEEQGIENVLIEALNKLKNSPDTDPETKQEIENALLEAINKAAQPSVVAHEESEPNDDLPPAGSNLVAEDDNSLTITAEADEDVDETVADIEAIDEEIVTSKKKKKTFPASKRYQSYGIPRMSRGTTKKSNKKPSVKMNGSDPVDHISNEKSHSTPTDTDKELVMSHSVAVEEPEERSDVVSSAVAVAALGAAAVTANPLILAGVALGPVIRDSIASAKSRVKTSDSTSEDIEEDSDADAPTE